MSGIYPELWSTSYINPIFKSNDPSKPCNYRGIAINPCIGKLFNSILNSRLDKHLETNKLIHPCQIGFSKKCRTSNHVYVLKTLIDKYTNKKGGKLFACFVDFRRAFDTVIHEGIKYKLLQNNIGGNSYRNIKNIYSKYKVCIRIGNRLHHLFVRPY